MKKAILILIGICLISCGASKAVRESEKVLKGNWNLSSINYSEKGTFDVTLLNDATKDCFISSTWQFIPNNNTGIYNIINSDCNTGERYFIFTIQEIDETTGLYDFLLKPTDEKGKSDTNLGFRLKLVSLSETTMEWEQTVNVEGEPFTISMNFTKL